MVLVQWQIVGDCRTVAFGRMRVVPGFIENQQARAKLERFVNIVRDHEDRHGTFVPKICVGKRRNVTHVDTPANHSAAFAEGFERNRYQLSHRCKDNRCVDGLRRLL